MIYPFITPQQINLLLIALLGLPYLQSHYFNSITDYSVNLAKYINMRKEI